MGFHFQMMMSPGPKKYKLSKFGAVTFSIMTRSITTFSRMTLNITAVSIMKLTILTPSMMILISKNNCDIL